MLVFSAILPHAAILLPTVGKDNLKKMPKTIEALKKINDDFKAAKPDSVIVIFSHAGQDEFFSLYINKEYQSDFEKLGDFSTKLKFLPDFEMLANLRKFIRIKGFPLAVKGTEKLSYDATIPLFYTDEKQKANIVPLETAALPLKKHLDLGGVLKECIDSSNRRVAVIASANLSHALSTDAPGGLSPAGKEFDEKIQEFIANKNSVGLVSYDEQKLSEAKECASRPIAVLLGIMQQREYNPQIYSYEAPFGIGFLVANFKMDI